MAAEDIPEAAPSRKRRGAGEDRRREKREGNSPESLSRFLRAGHESDVRVLSAALASRDEGMARGEIYLFDYSHSIYLRLTRWSWRGLSRSDE